MSDIITPTSLAERTGSPLDDTEVFRTVFFHVVSVALRNDFMLVLPGAVWGGTQTEHEAVRNYDDDLGADHDGAWTLHGDEVAAAVGLESSQVLTTMDLSGAVAGYLALTGATLDEDVIDRLTAYACAAIDPLEHPGLVLELGPVDRESVIEDWIVAHLSVLATLFDRDAFTLYADGGRTGQQWRFSNGRRADLICRAGERLVVIELKAGRGLDVDARTCRHRQHRR